MPEGEENKSKMDTREGKTNTPYRNRVRHPSLASEYRLDRFYLLKRDQGAQDGRSTGPILSVHSAFSSALYTRFTPDLAIGGMSVCRLTHHLSSHGSA